MAEPAVHFSMPRLRRAWLREMGIEALWPSGAAPTSAPANAVRQPPVPAQADDIAVARDIAAAPVEPPVINEITVERSAHPAPPPVQTAQVGVLLCRLYQAADNGVPYTWLVLADANELAASDSGPAVFLDNMMRAAQLDVRGATASLAVVRDNGRLACQPGLAAAFSQDRQPGAVVLVGRLARHALGLRSRLGELATLDWNGQSIPAMALPALSDVTALAGKPAVWRALRALAAAQP